MTVQLQAEMAAAENGSAAPRRMRKFEDDARLGAIGLGYSLVLPFALKSVIRLGVLNLLDQRGPGASLTARQIVDLLPTKPDHGAADCLDRQLRFLASFNVLTQSLAKADHSNGNGKEAVALERSYGLAPVCEYLVERPGEVSLVPLFLLNLDKEPVRAMQLFERAVTDGIQPFTEANGISLYERTDQDAEFGPLFNLAMASKSHVFFKGVVEHYDGFAELQGKTVVDVGGGTGSSMALVLARWPSIRAINFDLPSVVAGAPRIPGLDFQGGDMFVQVPSADAVFMKWILHNWTDEFCIKILRNCHKALPANGKVIVVDAVVPSSHIDGSLATRVALGLDMLMLAWTKGGKERTEEEFRSLFEAAGFLTTEVVLQVDFLAVVEARKG